MKAIFKYISFNCALVFTSVTTILCFTYKGDSIHMIFCIINGILAVICWIIFLNKLSWDKKVNKEGKFVRGKLVRDSVNMHRFIKDLYIVRASVTYYDSMEDQTLVFWGQDLIKHKVLKMAMKTNDDIFVLVGYLPENSKRCIVYLSEAIERII